MPFGPGTPWYDDRYTDPKVPDPQWGTVQSGNSTSVPPVIGKIFYTTAHGKQQGPDVLLSKRFPMKNSYVPQLDYVAQERATNEITTPLWQDGDVSGAGVALWTPVSNYGRNVVVSSRVDVYGYDYLGQPMTEDVDGTTGLKAFFIVTGQSGAATLTHGVRLGLPYAYLSGGSAGGTWVAADTTDPARDIEGDPRGTFQPSSFPGTPAFVEVSYTPRTSNLHGVRHFHT